MEPDEYVAERLAGWRVGTGRGRIICDGCGARLQLEEPGDTVPMTGYVTAPRNRERGHRMLKVYCKDCDDREITTSTSGVDEAMVSFRAVWPEAGHPPLAQEVLLIDRAGP